jgi:hypothetical protein
MSTSSPIRVKFLSRGNRPNKNQIWMRQFPQNKPVWGNCKFIFDEGSTEYDWLVVYDDLPPARTERFSKRKEQLRCHQKNTLLVTSEPSTIKVYGSKFLNQFEHVLTTQEPWAIKHKNAIYSQCGYIWYYGVGSTHLQSWDDISAHQPKSKEKIISTVCSNKKQKNTVHNQRFKFTKKLKEKIPELDIYGYGVQPIDDKADAIDAYKYHVVIENISSKDHWSEKLADAFLGNSMPIYYGCTNIFDYFPKNSIILFNPYEEDRSIAIIEDAIKNNLYEKHIEEIKQARDLVLNTYNFFAVVSEIVEKHHCLEKVNTLHTTTICSRHAVRRKNPLNFLQYFVERYTVKLKHFFSSAIS